MVKGKKKGNGARKAPARKAPVSARPGPKKAAASAAASFGPVATIDTAPVSIGNSVKGSSPVVIPVKDGVRIQGRDFLCNIAPTDASITGWTLVGGCPLIPHALVSSLLKSYAGIYGHFVVNGLAFHYITACPTSVPGDVMLYIGKTVADPGIDNSSTNFMSVVLSDHNTIFGPLWQNHTASFFPPPAVYPTDIFNDEDLTHRGPGELFVFTKTAGEQVPGYIIMDYDITFSGMQVNIRALTFPISRMKYSQVGLAITGAATTINLTAVVAVVTGTLLDGSTVGTIPSGTNIGDVFKCILCVTPATFAGATTANLLTSSVQGSGGFNVFAPQQIKDGYTVYAVYYTTNALLLYDSYVDAVAQTQPYRYGVTGAAIGFNIPAFISLVGNTGQASLAQSNI